MGTVTDTLLRTMMGWVRTLVGQIWAIFTSDRATILEMLGKYWMVIAAVIIGIGLFCDALIWLIRWRPYHIWAMRAREILHIEDPEETAKREQARRRDVYEAGVKERAEKASAQRKGSFMPELPFSDEELDKVLTEAHGYKLKPGEEIRMLPPEEMPENGVMLSEARKNAEQREAQERYARELAEYEVKRAQYERDLAEYERQKAVYEAQLAAAHGEKAPAQTPAAASDVSAANTPRRRRRIETDN